MEKLFRSAILIAVAILGCLSIAGTTYAQAKKKAPVKKKPVRQAPAAKKSDTVVVLVNEKKDTLKADSFMTMLKRIDTVIIIDRATGKPKPASAVKATPKPPPRPIDTVIVLKNWKKKEGTPVAKDTIKVVRRPPMCSCVDMKIKAPDTLNPNDYVNYHFLMKNNCKERIWVSSSSFNFLVFNKNGTPAHMLRKLDYVKRYNYPDFVPLEPGEEYQFLFGDDPFFQYELRRGWDYKFTFYYYNKSHKYKTAPALTYTCSEYRDKLIRIK